MNNEVEKPTSKDFYIDNFCCARLQGVRHICSCYNFSMVHVCVLCIRPSGFILAIVYTFMLGFQNNLAQLLSLRSRSAI